MDPVEEKRRYVTNLRDIHMRMAQLLADAEAVHAVGFERGYHAWQDEDLEGVILLNGQPITANDLVNMVFRIADYSAFMRNGVVGQMDRLTISQKFRSDL